MKNLFNALKKAADVAKEIKDAAADVGLLDGMSSSTNTGGSVSASDEAGQSSQNHISQHGPAMLEILTPEEVARITGAPIDQVGRYYDDEWVGQTFTSSDQESHAYFEVRIVREAGGVDGMWDFIKHEVTDKQPEASLGDEAFSIGGESLYIKAPQQVIHIFGGPSGDLPSFEIIKELGRAALARV